MIADTAIISRGDTALSSRVEDSVVMMDIESGNYYEIDTTAAQIWEMIDPPIAFSELCGSLGERYQVDAEQCRLETAQFIEKLQALGLAKLS